MRLTLGPARPCCPGSAPGRRKRPPPRVTADCLLEGRPVGNQRTVQLSGVYETMSPFLFSHLLLFALRKRPEPGSSGILPLAEPVCPPGSPKERRGGAAFAGSSPSRLSPAVVLQVAKLILAPRAAPAAFRLLRSTCLRREASGPLSHASRHCFLLSDCEDTTQVTYLYFRLPWSHLHGCQFIFSYYSVNSFCFL